MWVFADREGHIGMQASGWLPQRGGGNSGIVPIAAWDPENHWQGRVRADLLPREYDPPCGFVASANEELYRSDGPPLHAHGLPDYRKRRIVERLDRIAAGHDRGHAGAAIRRDEHAGARSAAGAARRCWKTAR